MVFALVTLKSAQSPVEIQALKCVATECIIIPKEAYKFLRLMGIRVKQDNMSCIWAFLYMLSAMRTLASLVRHTAIICCSSFLPLN